MFDWTINEKKQWPPPQRPRPPFGPTTLDVMRACALKACFEASKGVYERKLDFAARVGSAYHRTVEYLTEKLPTGLTAEEAAEIAVAHFEKELARERSEKALRPREKLLPEDETRVERALEAVIQEAHRLTELPLAITEREVRLEEATESASRSNSSISYNHKVGWVESEISVTSQDGLFTGRIDRVEYHQEGVQLIDFKSALRDDVPERYQRQLQLYAYLWQASRGQWPIAARLIYPFKGTEHSVPVEPTTCQTVAEDFRQLVAQVDGEKRIDRLAKPGEICKICDFRPWCKPFWGWQATETNQRQALERSSWGLEGEIINLTPFRDGEGWEIQIKWRNLPVRLVVPAQRFPQLAKTKSGQRVRAIDLHLQGNPFRPQAIIRDSSELFLLES